MRRLPLLLLLCGLLAVAGGCRREPAAFGGGTGPAHAAGAIRPAQAVQLLGRHLRHNDLVAFARDAVPPAWHAQLEAAWREGRTRWPLEELPFAKHLPTLLGSLAAPGSEVRLQQVFDRQFAGANVQIRDAAASLGLFGAQYVEHAADYSADERQHYAQLIEAARRWGMTAPLGDRERARVAIAELAASARRTGLVSDTDFRAAGMDESLQRMGGVSAAFKQALVPYGIDLDASLDGMQATLEQQTGDSARVRMRYTLGAQTIDAIVPVRRIDGRWYLSDYLRHAEAAIRAPVAPTR